MTNGYRTCHGDHFVMYLIAESVCCTLETNLILYVNYTLIKIKWPKIVCKK